MSEKQTNFHSIDRAIDQLMQLTGMMSTARYEFIKSLYDDSTATADEIKKLNNTYKELEGAVKEAEIKLKHQLGNNFTLKRLFPNTTAQCRADVEAAERERNAYGMRPFEFIFETHPLLNQNN